GRAPGHGSPHVRACEFRTRHVRLFQTRRNTTRSVVCGRATERSGKIVGHGLTRINRIKTQVLSVQIRGQEPALALQRVSDNAQTHPVPSEANSRIVSSFIDYLKVEKGLGVLTVSAYSRDIVQFAAFLDRSKRTLLNARRDDVRG